MTCVSTRSAVAAVRPALAVLSTTAALTLLASAAGADCPTGETARKGFTMKTDQNVLWEITGSDGDTTKVVETVPNPTGPGLVTRHAIHRGLVTISSARADYTSVLVFEPSLESFFPLVIGKQATFKMLRRIEAKPEVIARLKMRPEVAGTMALSVVRNEASRIGDCGYNAILVDRDMRFDGEPHFTIRQRYVPELRVTQLYAFARDNPGKAPTVSKLHFTSIASK